MFFLGLHNLSRTVSVRDSPPVRGTGTGRYRDDTCGVYHFVHELDKRVKLIP